MSATLTDNFVVPSDGLHIKPHRAWLVLLLLMSIGMMALGFWLLFHWRGNPNVLWASPLCIGLFGWLAQLMILRLVRHWGTTITPEGIFIPGPTFLPKLVRWNDIEGFSAFKIRNNSFTGMQIKDCTDLIRQYSPREVHQMMRRQKILGRVSLAIAANQLSVPEREQASSDVADMASYFAGQRRTYGCEIMFAYVDRDRSAEEFATFLEGLRERYAGKANA
jgi:hypothetical protein